MPHHDDRPLAHRLPILSELLMGAVLLALSYPLCCLGGLLLFGAGANMLTPEDFTIAAAMWVPLVVVAIVHSHRLALRDAGERGRRTVSIGRWGLFAGAEVALAFLLLVTVLIGVRVIFSS